MLFIALGRWQWRRGNLHAAEHASFERGAREVLALGRRPLTQVPSDQRVSVTGTYDSVHQFLIDNMSYNDVDGYQVLTPLERPRRGDGAGQPRLGALPRQPRRPAGHRHQERGP